MTPRNREERPAPVFHYALHEGDTVYLDDRPFIVDRVGPLEASFRDPSMAYPLFRSESREMLVDAIQEKQHVSAVHTEDAVYEDCACKPNKRICNEAWPHAYHHRIRRHTGQL